MKVGYFFVLLVVGFSSLCDSVSSELNVTSVQVSLLQEILKKYTLVSPLQNTTESTTGMANPGDLLCCQRFDIAAKYIYAKQRELLINIPWAQDLYAEHLRVMNNYIDTTSEKNQLDDFLKAFDATLDSIKKDGYNTALSPVLLDKKGIIVNGAHLTAACLLYNKDISWAAQDNEITQLLSSNRNTGSASFIKGGLETKYLDAMALKYCELKDNTYIACIFPVAEGKTDEITKIFSAYGSIVYTKNIYLNPVGTVNFVREIYDYAHWIGSPKNNFAGARKDAAKRFPQDSQNPLRIYLFECKNLHTVRACKKEIRKLFDAGDYAIHINDTYDESLVLARMVFNANSIHLINHAVPTKFNSFLMLLEKYKTWLRENKADQECFCIDSGPVLAAYGLRDCNDINFLHHGYNQVAEQTNSMELRSHNAWLPTQGVSLDEIIFNPANHFYYKGVKFAAVDVAKDIKQKINREKDKADLPLFEMLQKNS